MHRRAPNLKQNRVRPLSAAPTLYSSTYDQPTSHSSHNSEVGDGQYEERVAEQPQQQYEEYSDHPSDYSSSSPIMSFERLKINIEIFLEGVADTIGASYDSLRKPLLALACFALIMTLKAGKRGVARMKGVTRQAYSPYGTPGVPRVPPNSAAYGQRPAYPAGAAPAGGAASPYSRSTLQAAPNAYGQPAGGAYGTPPIGGAASPYGGAAGGGGGGGGLSGVAGLVDMHGATIRVMQPGLFKDYGAVTDFQGQVETLHGFESAAVVEQVLNQPGQNKVLVVDGGGDLRAAIFDANMAMAAQRNGWKGVIINGAVRNARQLATTNLGIKALGTNPVRGQAQKGQPGAALTFGGLQINPGFWIYADKDGIVISERGITGASLSGGGGVAASPYGGTANSAYGNAGSSYGAGGTSAYGTAGGAYGTPSTGLRGTAATNPYGSAATPGAYGQAAPANTAAYNRAAPAAGARAYATATQRGAVPTRGSYSSYGQSRNSKKFLGKFVGICFLFTSFMLMIKSVQGD